MSRTFLSIVKKEFWHIVRDYQTLIIIFIMPVIMLIMYGYAITLEMRHISIAISDQSHTPQSRQFIHLLQSNHFFTVKTLHLPPAQFQQALQTRTVRCIVVIPPDFGSALVRNSTTSLQLLIDASDPNAANYIRSYVQKIIALFNQQINLQVRAPFEAVPRFLFNPDLKSRFFFVPGLIAIIVLLISALLTSIAIVREKEMGTFEQILVSPVHAHQIILGKVIPYILLGFIDSVIILLIGHFWFKVPIRGSMALLLFTLVLYLLSGLSLGLFMSTITKSQRAAMLGTLLMTILPTILLSGFIFPIPSMPIIFQYVSQIIPATHFLKIIRGILLKGNGLTELKGPILWLVGLGTFLMLISIKKFKTSLE